MSVTEIFTRCWVKVGPTLTQHRVGSCCLPGGPLSRCLWEVAGQTFIWSHLVVWLLAGEQWGVLRGRPAPSAKRHTDRDADPAAHSAARSQTQIYLPDLFAQHTVFCANWCNKGALSAQVTDGKTQWRRHISSAYIPCWANVPHILCHHCTNPDSTCVLYWDEVRSADWWRVSTTEDVVLVFLLTLGIISPLPEYKQI